jgi:GT2 family glycosyltransferase
VPSTPDGAEGSTQLVSAQCWDACGGWDESFFLYSEETDFALRARDLGHRTAFVPTAGAIHLQGDSTVSPGLWALLVANKVRLYRRRRGPAAGAAFWLAMVVREASRAAAGSTTSRAALTMLLSPSRMTRPPGPETVRATAKRV